MPVGAAVGERRLAVATTRAELATARASLGGPVAVVMTMGALHEGHAELLRRAREHAEHVIVTVFVNPLQFGPGEDYDRYPRSFGADREVCRQGGVDVLFAPAPEVVFPGGGPRIHVSAGQLGEILEGVHRPGHFDGVLTVVLTLLELTAAQVALFGEKDYQQLTLVRAMVADFALPVRLVAVPTVREPDGLARSSRNAYLVAAERAVAPTLHRALRAGAAAAGEGRPVLAAARAVLERAPAIGVEYLELTDPQLASPPAVGPARLLVAARLGSTRLIDNIAVELVG